MFFLTYLWFLRSGISESEPYSKYAENFSINRKHTKIKTYQNFWIKYYFQIKQKQKQENIGSRSLLRKIKENLDTVQLKLIYQIVLSLVLAKFLHNQNIKQC